MRSTGIQAALTTFCTVLTGVLVAAATAPQAAAQNPFYAGKRLTVLVNYAPGGGTDSEARVFLRHISRLIDGEPSVVIQNMEGAGGVVGAKYLGEVAPRDGSMMGYLTAAAFHYGLEPERFRVDVRTYNFIGLQPSTSVNFVRTDVPPGMKLPADFLKAQGIVLGSLAADSPKGVRMRLALDLLGLPYKYISGYRSGGAAKLAIERGEINFFGELPPSYFSIVEPGMVKAGTVIPVYWDSGFDGEKFFVPDSVKAASVAPFHEFYRSVKGAMPTGPLWEAYKAIVAADGTLLRLVVLPPEAPPGAVSALREALSRLNQDKGYAEDSQKAFGYVPVWQVSLDNNAIAARSMTIAPATRTFIQEYIKNTPK